jgi:hypothetical protein
MQAMTAQGSAVFSSRECYIENAIATYEHMNRADAQIILFSWLTVIKYVDIRIRATIGTA